MKRHNIEFLLGWLDALRRGDREAVREAIASAAIWRAVDPAFTCHGADEIADTFAAARDAAVDIDSLELIGAPRHAILRVRWPEIVESEAEFLDGIYSVFAIEDGRITRIDDYVEREPALAAAGIS